MKNVHRFKQNIYITSDEEIKEGDWGFDGLDIFKCLKPFIANETTSGKNIPCFYIEYDGKSNIFHETSYIKKIILTTDQDLINDDIQAIDDEFLEWFVKNPSCEEVKTKLVEFEVDMGLGEECIEYGSYYEIIIPQEEPKQEDEIIDISDHDGIGNAVDNLNNEEPKQETLEDKIYQAVGLAANEQGIINQALATSKVMDILKKEFMEHFKKEK
jgi:hypothetical protein